MRNTRKNLLLYFFNKITIFYKIQVSYNFFPSRFTSRSLTIHMIAREGMVQSFVLSEHSEIFATLHPKWLPRIFNRIAITRLLLDEPYYLWELTFDWSLTTQAVDLTLITLALQLNRLTKCTSHLQTFFPKYFVAYLSLFEDFHFFEGKLFASH